MITPPDDLPKNLIKNFYYMLMKLFGKVHLHDDNADIAAWIMFRVTNKEP